MHRLPCLHHRLRGGKQTAAGRGLPGGAGGGDRALSSGAAAFCAPALPALPESPLRQGLSGHRHLENRTGHGGHRLQQMHRLPLLPGGLPLCGPHLGLRGVVHRRDRGTAGEALRPKGRGQRLRSPPRRGIRPEVARARPWLSGGQRPQVPFLPAPPEGGHAAGLHHLVHRPGHHLRRPHRPPEPGLRDDRLPPGLSLEGRTGHPALRLLFEVGEKGEPDERKMV